MEGLWGMKRLNKTDIEQPFMIETRTLSDAHTHIGTDKEWKERKEAGILSLLCASTPEEAEKLFAIKGDYLIPTCGVHPWYAGIYPLEDMLKYIRRCPVLGEIGMDNVWCNVPLKVQEDVFRQQLTLARQWKKPVILHTKGQEKEIADIIRNYPNRYLVHWYSSEYNLEEYLEMDCYFSIGPDVNWNPAVRQVAEKVPFNKLLIETDGLLAVRWAQEERFKLDTDKKISEQSRKKYQNFDNTVVAALEEILENLALIWGISPEEAGKICKHNLTAGFLDDMV